MKNSSSKNSYHGPKHIALNRSHLANSNQKTKTKTLTSFFHPKKKKKTPSYSQEPKRKRNSRRTLPKHSFELPVKAHYKYPIFENNSGRGKSSSRRGLSMYMRDKGRKKNGCIAVGSFAKGKNMKIRNIKLRHPVKGSKLRKKR